MNVKIKDLLKDTGTFAIGNLGSKLILFLLVPLYTNFLTTEEYGTAELVFTLSQLIIPILTVTIWNGVIRFGLMAEMRPVDVIKNGFAVWTASVLIEIMITPLLGFYEPIRAWKWYLCAYSAAYSVNLIELNYLKVKGKNKLFAAVSLIQTLLLALLNILLIVYFKTGVSGYLISNIIANVAAVFIIFFVGGIYIDLAKGHLENHLLKRMVLYSAPLILNDISWWAIHSSDKIMVEAMVGAAALGLYTVAAKIPGLINTFVNIFSQAWGVSSIKEIETSNDKMFYANVFKTYCALAFGASIFFIAVIRPFMRLYVGVEFQGAWVYVPILLVAASFSAISAYFGSMYGALQKSVECMWTTIIGAVANIILNYFFIRSLGTLGAIIGTVAAYFIIASLRLFGVNRYIQMPISGITLLNDILIALCEAILVTLDFHIVIVSCTAIIAFIINHIRDFAALLRFLRRVK